MPDDYLYDAFFSYKRDEVTLFWMREVSKKLRYWLSEELGGVPARIFVDETSVEIGNKWPQTIKDALKYSRCLIGVWSPSYFQSDWCVSEWKSFRERETLAGLGKGLVAPLKFHDGQHFPEEARQTQWVDVAQFAITLPAFWTSANAIGLEDKLKEFSKSVAEIIKRAPAFRPDWPIIDAKGVAAGKIGLAKL